MTGSKEGKKIAEEEMPGKEESQTSAQGEWLAFQRLGTGRLRSLLLGEVDGVSVRVEEEETLVANDTPVIGGAVMQTVGVNVVVVRNHARAIHEEVIKTLS